ncbi:hypothetical protein ACHAWX_006398 [Stephanocyclus meneghinianus]
MSTMAKLQSSLRIASLLPSTTDICMSLGLGKNIVGITHECDFPSAAPLISCHANNHEHLHESTQSVGRPSILTVSTIDPGIQSQSDIDKAVKTSLYNGISLYHLNNTALSDARPDVILTQSLCEVCAVSKEHVDKEVACHLPSSKVVSLEPESLEDVAQSFVTVAEGCGVKQRGEELKRLFLRDIDRVSEVVSANNKRIHSPKVMFMEWIDPPFDGGHWIPDMIQRSGASSAIPSSAKSSRKSTQLTWKQVYEYDPDTVIIACCGFDLKRNIQDAMSVKDKLRPMRAFRERKIFASNGNLYFARPGPALREGVAIMARCAFDEDKDVVDALEGLGFMPREGEGWARVNFHVARDEIGLHSNRVTDVEDLIRDHDDRNYSKLHDDACREGKDTYIDPKTGYCVFTELAHTRRGKCCGSGCRHCPYNHVNVKDKSKNIQQPAFLYEGVEDSDASNAFFSPISAIPPNSYIKVLFFSGGKDSFLTIRKLVQQQQTINSRDAQPFHLILLTTFDSTTRVIAHQEIPIETVLKQAKHLQIPLLAIPLHRDSGETYLERIEKGLDVIRERVADIKQIKLVFGDLHLDHIRQWRDAELSQYSLEYPLWKISYSDLFADLEASQVRVVLSASTVDGVNEGMVFTREFMDRLVELGYDGFGENGEYHSVAEVWNVSRDQALGLTTK